LLPYLSEIFIQNRLAIRRCTSCAFEKIDKQTDFKVDMFPLLEFIASFKVFLNTYTFIS